MVVVPYRHEDPGYTKTVIKQLSDNNNESEEPLAKDKHLQLLLTLEKLMRNRVEYSQCHAGVLIYKFKHREQFSLILPV